MRIVQIALLLKRTEGEHKHTDGWFWGGGIIYFSYYETHEFTIHLIKFIYIDCVVIYHSSGIAKS